MRASTAWLTSLVALARPRLLPFVLMLPAVGFAWAHWDRALTARGGPALAGVLIGWTLLHAGTLWLNAALDRDEGEVLLGARATPPPGIVVWGRLALVGAVVAAAWADPLAGVAALICAVLAELYSNPVTAWKGRPVAGPAVNVVGYGLLSPLAGWAVVDVAMNGRTAWMALVVAAGVLGSYFVAQAFQAEEDRSRGYRTLVATHGTGTAIDAARACFAVGYVVSMALAVAGWLPRAALIAVPTWWWVDRGLRDWRGRAPGSAADAAAIARRLAWSGLLVVAAVFVDYVGESLRHEPVAGLGTVAGLPDEGSASTSQGLRPEGT